MPVKDSTGDSWGDRSIAYAALPLYRVCKQEIWNAPVPGPTSEHAFAECPILIDSAASFTDVGNDWLSARNRRWGEKIAPISRLFRFGEGTFCPTIGGIFIQRVIPFDHSSTGALTDLRLHADLSDIQVPMMSSKNSLAILKATMEFAWDTSAVLGNNTISLISSGTGRIRFPANRRMAHQKDMKHGPKGI